jgi:hypothetical protein
VGLLQAKDFRKGSGVREEGEQSLDSSTSDCVVIRLRIECADRKKVIVVGRKAS